MAEEADLELDCETEAPGGSSSQPVRKNIAIKLKQLKPKAKGRKTRNKSEKQGDPDGLDSSDDQYLNASCDSSVSKNMSPSDSMFPCQPLLWSHKVNLIGTKVTDPVIHCCEKCTLPILTYGRMIPCKHVFCFDCAKKTEKTCPRCGDPVQRIEQSALGSVFVCTYGGAKHGVSGCRRTYLSQRDLQAHINHRHLRQGGPEPPPPKTQQQVVGPPLPLNQQQQQQQPPHIGPPPMQPPGGHQPLPVTYVPVTAPSQPMGNLDIMPPPIGQHDQVVYHRPPPMEEPSMVGQPPPPPHIPQHMHGPPPPPQHPRVPPPPQPPQHGGVNVPPPPPPQPQHVSVSMPPPPPPLMQQHVVSSHDNYSISSIPVMSNTTRTNLITVPIQDEGEYRPDQQQPPQQHPPGFPPPGRNFNTATPPPVTFPPNHPLQVSVHVPPPQQPPPFPPNSMALSPQGLPVATYAPPSSVSHAAVAGPPPPLYSSQQTFTQSSAHSHSGPPPPCVLSTQHLPGGTIPQPRVGSGPPPLSNPPPVGNPLQPHPTGPPPRMGLPGSNQPPPRFPNPHGPYEEPPPLGPNYTPQPGSPRMAWTSGPPPRPPHPRPPGPVGPPPQQRPQTDNTHYNQYY